MKKTKENPVILTLKGKNTSFTARLPLWKAYLILADLEIEEEKKKKLKNPPHPPKERGGAKEA